MTATVTLHPSGHQFTVEPDETILEAALRSGININYYCSNGSCGECKARVMEGELAEIQHHDYVLSAAEKRGNTVLLCRARAQDDMLLEASEAGTTADIPVQKITTQVTLIENPQQDVTVITLRTPRSQTLRFLAGQHVCLAIPDLLPRNKSIASCPCNGRFLQIHQRRVPGDAFSEHLFSQLKTRDRVDIEGPFGGFIMDESSTRPMILLAYDTGFSAIKSLIEHAISLDIPQPVALYWVMPFKKEHYLENYCRSWKDALDDFSYTPICALATDSPSPEAMAENALLQAVAQVTADYSDLHEIDLYVNGPQAVLDVARNWLVRHGLPEKQLFVDHIRRF